MDGFKRIEASNWRSQRPGGKIDSEKQCLKEILNEMEKRSADSEAGKEEHNEKWDLILVFLSSTGELKLKEVERGFNRGSFVCFVILRIGAVIF